MSHAPTLLELVSQEDPVAAVRQLGTLPGDVLSELPISPALFFACQRVLQQSPEADAGALESIPFYSLCRGYFLPMLGLPEPHERRFFGTSTGKQTPESRTALLETFLKKPLGLTLEEKVCLASGDLYAGRPPAAGEETLLRLLAEECFSPIAPLRQELVEAGGLPQLYCLKKRHERSQLGARTVALCILALKEVRGRRRRDVLRDLLAQCGRLEAYVVVGLLLDKLHLGWSGRQDQILAVLSGIWKVPLESLQVACGLRELSEICHLIEHEGPEALQKIVLQPLAAFRPALAGATLSEQPKFPTWVECKYDGIRMILHKTCDSAGRVLVAAFTRKRHDWSELLPGLRPLLQAVPARSVILDGELHGYLLAASGVPRPATVYEVHQMLRGEIPDGGVVQLRYVAFDLLYLEGHDWTKVPFSQRRVKLEQLLAWPSSQSLPLPIQLSSGARVANKEELARFYEQYRRQGHEGLMVKEESSPYPLAQRSPHWIKKKPEETLDLVITAAYWGQSTSPGQRMFDTYSIACRAPQGWREVGKVAGVDGATTRHIAQEIWRCQLLTGDNAESRGHDRVHVGVRLAPQLVVSIRFEAVLKDLQTGDISLRGPRIVALRSGEMPLEEVSTEKEMETLALRHRIS